MTSLLAIDPGNKTGMAMFDDDFGRGWRLTHAQVVRPDDGDGYVLPDVVVIECPTRVFAQATTRSICKLAMTAGRYVERYRRAHVETVEPRDWKGTVDGDIMTERIKAALSPEERNLCAKYKFDHNMLDAVGLGKWALRQPWMRVRR